MVTAAQHGAASVHSWSETHSEKEWPCLLMPQSKQSNINGKQLCDVIRKDETVDQSKLIQAKEKSSHKSQMPKEATATLQLNRTNGTEASMKNPLSMDFKPHFMDTLYRQYQSAVFIEDFHFQNKVAFGWISDGFFFVWLLFSFVLPLFLVLSASCLGVMDVGFVRILLVTQSGGQLVRWYAARVAEMLYQTNRCFGSEGGMACKRDCFPWNKFFVHTGKDHWWFSQFKCNSKYRGTHAQPNQVFSFRDYKWIFDPMFCPSQHVHVVCPAHVESPALPIQETVGRDMIDQEFQGNLEIAELTAQVDVAVSVAGNEFRPTVVAVQEVGDGQRVRDEDCGVRYLVSESCLDSVVPVEEIGVREVDPIQEVGGASQSPLRENLNVGSTSAIDLTTVDHQQQNNGFHQILLQTPQTAPLLDRRFNGFQPSLRLIEAIQEQQKLEPYQNPTE